MRVLKNYNPRHAVIDKGNGNLYIIYTVNAIKDKGKIYNVWARRELQSQTTFYCIKFENETPDPFEFTYTEKHIDKMWHDYCTLNKQRVFLEVK